MSWDKTHWKKSKNANLGVGFLLNQGYHLSLLFLQPTDSDFPGPKNGVFFYPAMTPGPWGPVFADEEHTCLCAILCVFLGVCVCKTIASHNISGIEST